jgi:isopentenyl diphosphate isomerase/L-lactate dehydrogenase-like FMN-dependent dehydrogenase
MPMKSAGLDEVRAEAHANWGPDVIADIEGAAHSGASYRNNVESFSRFFLMPRVFRTSESRDLSVNVLGKRLSMPVMLSPVGSQGRFHVDAEVGSLRGAAQAGTGMCVSCSSSQSIEEIAAAVPEATRWFQLALFRDRKVLLDLARRAEDSGYAALVVMAGTPIRATHGGRMRASSARSDWGWPNLAPYAKWGLTEVGTEAARLYGDARDPGYRWRDLEVLRRATTLPLVVKGIMSPDDARIAAETGFDGVYVSNTGGRQLDCAPGTLDVLPDVVEAAGPQVTILCDGGIRRGSDVVKALALGARAVLIGRPYIWGLGAAGEIGVRNVLETLRREIDEVLALVGCADLAECDASILRPVDPGWPHSGYGRR